MSQETDDIMAALKHHLAQLERKWRDVRDEAIRKQAPLEYRIGELTGERDDLARQLAELTHIVGTETPIAAFTLAETWQAEKAHLMDEIAQAREILSAVGNETLVSAANDLVREEQTTNEAYHKLHDLYWKEAVPALAELKRLARDVCERMAGDDNNVTPDTAAALQALEEAL